MRYLFANMSRFFAVFFSLLLSAVPACQAAPMESKNGKIGVNHEENFSDLETVAPEPLPPSVQLPSQQFREPLSPPQSPSSSPSSESSGKYPDLLLKRSAESIKLPPSLSPAPSEQYTRSSSPSSSPVIQSPQSPYLRKHPDPSTESPVRPAVSLPPSVSLPPRQFDTPSSTIVPCPPQLPPCPPECQLQPPVSEPEPPKKKTGWKNGLMNLMNVCLKAIVGSLTDLVVVTGERPPKKSRKTEFIFSFGKKKDRRVPNQPTDGNSDQEETPSVGCFWYRDLRTRAPRRPAPTCVNGPGGRQCNFCCVGENLFNCSNCLTINCNPTINCCSCTINVTVVNNITVENKENNLNAGNNT